MNKRSVGSGRSPAGSQEPEIPPPIRVLYVDDEPDQLVLCKYFLEQTGVFEVDTAESPKAAFGMIHGNSYRAIVSDYQMPDMNGLEFLRRVKGMGIGVCSILFTSFRRDQVLSGGIHAPVDFFVQKTGDARAQYDDLGQVVRDAVTVREKLSHLKPARGSAEPEQKDV